MPPADARNQAKSRIFTPCSGNGLPCSAESRGFATLRGSAGTLGRRAASAEHRLGVLAQQRRAPADLPARLGAEPLAGRIAEGAAELRVLDVGEALARRASARRARSRAACAAAPTAGRHPAPRATACRHRSRRGRSAAPRPACARAPRRPPAVPGTWRARRSASGGGGCRSACAPYFDSSGTRFFRSRAPMPWVMNQRPSLVWLMLGRMVRRLRRRAGRSAATAARAASPSA